MKKSYFSAALLAAMFAGGFAHAAVTHGTIKSIDNTAKTVTLGDGVTYVFSEQMYRHPMFDGYLTGDKVTVVWDMSGNNHLAMAMGPDISGGVTGKIKIVDEAKQTVTLENGVTYDFSGFSSQGHGLAGFRTGDHVAIIGVKIGGKESGRSISPAPSVGATGKVKSINHEAMTLTLENGTVYHFGKDLGTTMSGLLPGDAVTVTGFQIGNHHIAQAVSPTS
ncbi:MAG: DUF1344 domain-containing protein [Rhodobacteraceae bacterium]|nr:DUF1344 domain-containing protein [Paracoccaceae bacterium]